MLKGKIININNCFSQYHYKGKTPQCTKKKTITKQVIEEAKLSVELQKASVLAISVNNTDRILFFFCKSICPKPACPIQLCALVPFIPQTKAACSSSSSAGVQN